MNFAEKFREESKSAANGGGSSSFSSRFREETGGRLQTMALQRKEKNRLEELKTSQGLPAFQASLQEKEEKAKGFTGLGLFSDTQQSFRDIFKREEKDKDYLKQIQDNNNTIQELLKKRREEPDKANDYNIMLDALVQKNDMLTQASGGTLKDKTTRQLGFQALGTAADLMPFGAGTTAAGRMVLTGGAKKLAGSLLKEGAVFGAAGGASKVGQMDSEEITPKGALGEMITGTLIGAATNLGVGTVFNKIGEKLSKWTNGEKVDFTPKEKDFLKTVPEINDEKLFEQAGIEPPTKTTDTDLLSKTIAATDDDASILNLIRGKVPDNELSAVSRALKTVNNPDDVARILDEYNPERIREELAVKIATTDNEKKIATLIKDSVPATDIPVVSRILKNMEDEVEIGKILDEFKVKASEVVSVAEKADVPDQQRGDAIRRWMSSNTKFSEEQVKDFRARPVGVDELDFDANGNITLYRKGDVEPGKPQSFSLVTRENSGQVPVVVNKDEILVNFNSAEITELMKKAESNPGAKDSYLHALETFQNSESEVIAVKKSIDKPSVTKSKTETPKSESKKSEPKKEKKSESKKEEPKSTPTKTNSGLATTTLRDATERGMIKETESFDVPDLDTMKMRDQADKAVKLIAEDEELAIRIALGNENPPSGLKVGSVYSAVKEMAIKNGDVDLIRRLAESENINAFARELGQEVKAFDSGIFRDPVKVIKNILDMRAESAGKNAKSEVSAELKQLKSNVVKAETGDAEVASFIQDIKC